MNWKNYEEKILDLTRWYEYGFTYSVEYAKEHVEEEELRSFFEDQVSMFVENDPNYEGYPDNESFIKEMTAFLYEKAVEEND